MSSAEPPRDAPSGVAREAPESPLQARARVVAAVVCAVQAIALAAFCAFYIVEVARGGEDDTTRALMSVVLIALFGVALVVLEVQWWRGSPWVRTPTIVWNLLLLPVAWGLVQSGRLAVAVAVGGVALAGLWAAIVVGDTHDLPDE